MADLKPSSTRYPTSSSSIRDSEKSTLFPSSGGGGSTSDLHSAGGSSGSRTPLYRRSEDESRGPGFEGAAGVEMSEREGDRRHDRNGNDGDDLSDDLDVYRSSDFPRYSGGGNGGGDGGRGGLGGFVDRLGISRFVSNVSSSAPSSWGWSSPSYSVLPSSWNPRPRLPSSPLHHSGSNSPNHNHYPNGHSHPNHGKRLSFPIPSRFLLVISFFTILLAIPLIASLVSPSALAFFSSRLKHPPPPSAWDMIRQGYLPPGTGPSRWGGRPEYYTEAQLQALEELDQVNRLNEEGYDYPGLGTAFEEGDEGNNWLGGWGGPPGRESPGGPGKEIGPLTGDKVSGPGRPEPGSEWNEDGRGGWGDREVMLNLPVDWTGWGFGREGNEATTTTTTTDGSKGIAAPKGWRPCWPPECPLADPGTQNSFAQFLDERFPPASFPKHLQPLIWVTLADKTWIRTGTAHLSHFLLHTLNPSPPSTRYGRRTELVILCLDVECLDLCQKDRTGWCFGGYIGDGIDGRPKRPEIMFSYTWPKVQGLIDFLATGRDVFFVDSDVYFKWNPYPAMGPLDKYDLQIGDENIDRQVNTGWFFLKSSTASTALWQAVLDRDLENVSRDQRNINILLNTFQRRIPEDDPDGILQDFVGEGGLYVHVLEREVFRAFHFAFDHHRQFAQEDPVFLHLTCGGSNSMKEYIGGAFGFWQDLGRRYSAPPPILTTTSLVGTQEQLKQQMRIMLAAAYYSGRAFLPPLDGDIADLNTDADFIPPGQEGKRYVWSMFPMDEFTDTFDMPILEPQYINHATHNILGSGADSQTVRMDLVSRLNDVINIDVRRFDNLSHLVHDLNNQQNLRTRGVLRLVNWMWAQEKWGDWKVPQKLKKGVEMCADLDKQPDCAELCRGENEREKRQAGIRKMKWEAVEDV